MPHHRDVAALAGRALASTGFRNVRCHALHPALIRVADLIVVVAGQPLAATVTGWLVAGREPPVIARQPLD